MNRAKKIGGEKERSVDPVAQIKQQAQSYKDKPESKDSVEVMEKEDKDDAERQIKKIKKFLDEVVEEEKKRQAQMRKRVEQITEEKLKADRNQEESGELVEPGTKAKRGSFLQKLKRKGKGAMMEARGAAAKGGG